MENEERTAQNIPENQPSAAEEPNFLDDAWFDSLLNSPETGDEIEADEHAVNAAGLSDISDMDLEKIIQEAIAGEFGEDSLEQAPDELSITPLDDLYSDDDSPIPPEEEEAEPEPQEPQDNSRPPRKVRPKRKNKYGLLGIPHLMSIIIWLTLTAVIGISMGRLLWICASDVLAFGRPDQQVTLTITERDDMDDIINKLYNAGLIKYPSLFKIYANLAHADQKVSVGTFTLNKLYDYHALVSGLSSTSSYREEIKVLIPEGYTCAQIFALLEEKGVCKAADLEKYASESSFESYEFLDGVVRGDKYCLEGYLFPDTYNFYTSSTPQQVFIKFLDRFGSQFDATLLERLDELNDRLRTMMKKHGYGSDYIESHLMTVHDIVIIASMIEKESANSAESYDVASVIYNRLSNPDYPFLNIDATIVYALGGKKDLTAEDKEIDSPYNTYRVEGLPPTPISNPGKTSLGAALGPTDTNYYFYALDPSLGSHHFSETYKEHQAFLDSLH